MLISFIAGVLLIFISVFICFNNKIYQNTGQDVDELGFSITGERISKISNSIAKA